MRMYLHTRTLYTTVQLITYTGICRFFVLLKRFFWNIFLSYFKLNIMNLFAFEVKIVSGRISIQIIDYNHNERQMEINAYI